MFNFVSKVLAASPPTAPTFNPGLDLPGMDPDAKYTIYQYLSAWLNFLINYIGPGVAVAMIIYGGIRYILSRGQESETTAAKEIITGAVLGLLLLLLIRMVLNIFNTDLGA